MIDNAPRTPLSTAFSINTSPSPFSVSPVSMPDLRNMRVHPLTSSPYSSQRAKDFRALLLEEPPRAYSTPISKRELRSSSSNGKPRKKNCYVYREQREDSDSELEETLSWRRGKLNWRNGDAVDEDDYEKGPGTDEEIVLGVSAVWLPFFLIDVIRPALEKNAVPFCSLYPLLALQVISHPQVVISSRPWEAYDGAQARAMQIRPAAIYRTSTHKRQN